MPRRDVPPTCRAVAGNLSDSAQRRPPAGGRDSGRSPDSTNGLCPRPFSDCGGRRLSCCRRLSRRACSKTGRDCGRHARQPSDSWMRPAVPGYFVATGHFRDGILLAPVTAQIMARLVTGRAVGYDLAPFSVERFAKLEALLRSRRAGRVCAPHWDVDVLETSGGRRFTALRSAILIRLNS